MSFNSLTRVLAHSAAVVVLISAPLAAEGAGKKPNKPTDPQKPDQPAYQTPNPVRDVLIKEVGTRSFHLPNGKEINLMVDLSAIMGTELAPPTVTNLRPYTDSSTAEDPCLEHIEVKAVLTAIQLEVSSFGITFGYTPTGESSTVTDVTGSADVQIGSIVMDFSLQNCKGTRCAQVASAMSDTSTVSLDLKATVNFDEMTTGAQFMKIPEFAAVFRQIIQNGLKRISSHPSIPSLPWMATVFSVSGQKGTVEFDRGSDSNIFPNQTFAVYYPVENAPGKCPVYKTAADIHTVGRAERFSSEAMIDATLSGERGVQIGDHVMVRQAK